MRNWIAAALATMLATAAAAETITYNVTGACDGSCANVGLVRGDLLFGTVTINRPTIVIGGTFDETNLVNFSITFGSTNFTRASAAGASLLGVWGDDLDTIAALDLRAATAVAPGTGVGMALMLGGSIVSTTASCATAACDSLGWTSAASMSNVRLTAVPGPAPVPLPPALGLAVAGVSALAAARGARRRR
ncbi:hypothetical protein [Amaricoccus sp.]|uniref:hypothetical protein n=1 Tax=Amaricoccus sp. TaxID=1872485 RepID=UPI001B61EBC6|nr:hypothetical protein [Amaricoccus sp.]MBP7000075.1 hypothetical protein [Amaricoccus sp.]